MDATIKVLTLAFGEGDRADALGHNRVVAPLRSCYDQGRVERMNKKFGFGLSGVSDTTVKYSKGKGRKG